MVVASKTTPATQSRGGVKTQRSIKTVIFLPYCLRSLFVLAESVNRTNSRPFVLVNHNPLSSKLMLCSRFKKILSPLCRVQQLVIVVIEEVIVAWMNTGFRYVFFLHLNQIHF